VSGIVKSLNSLSLSNENIIISLIDLQIFKSDISKLFLILFDPPPLPKPSIQLLELSASQINFEGDILPTNDLDFNIGSNEYRLTNVYSQNIETDSISVSGSSRLDFDLNKITTHVDIIPEITNSLNIGSSGFHFDKGYFNNVGSYTNTDFNIYQNNQNAISIQEGSIVSYKDLSLDNNNIKYLADPVDDNDAIGKIYFETYLAQNSWSVSGNFVGLDDTFKYIGTSNEADVLFKRNNVELMRLFQDEYTVGGVRVSEELEIINNTDEEDVASLTISTVGRVTGNEDSFNLNLRTGSTVEGNAGNLEISTGTSLSGNSGVLTIRTGDAPLGDRGILEISASEISFEGDIVPSQDLTFDIGASGYNLNRVYVKNLGSYNQEDVNFIRNQQTLIELKSTSIKHNIDITPQDNFSLDLGASGNHYDRVYVANVGTQSDTAVNIIQNNSNKLEINT
jgi:hypothetical protein